MKSFGSVGKQNKFPQNLKYIWGQHGGAVSAVALQQEGPEFDSTICVDVLPVFAWALSEYAGFSFLTVQKHEDSGVRLILNCSMV